MWDLPLICWAHLTFSTAQSEYIPRIRYFLTCDATKLLIQSLVLCRFSYCPVVWGGVNQKFIAKLQRILNFAARVMHRKGKSEYATPLLAELNWLTVKNRLNLDTACFMYRVAQSQVPANNCELFPGVCDNPPKTSRQSDDFYTLQPDLWQGRDLLAGAPPFERAWHLNWSSALACKVFADSTKCICFLNSDCQMTGTDAAFMFLPTFGCTTCPYTGYIASTTSFNVHNLSMHDVYFFFNLYFGD